MFTIQAMFTAECSTRDTRSGEAVLRYRDGVKCGFEMRTERESIASTVDSSFDRVSYRGISERKFSDRKTMWSDRT